MAQRQRDRVTAKRDQVSSAKNKRMVFMQKLEANSPAQKYEEILPQNALLIFKHQQLTHLIIHNNAT
jgi:hypothetical protein